MGSSIPCAAPAGDAPGVLDPTLMRGRHAAPKPVLGLVWTRLQILPIRVASWVMLVYVISLAIGVGACVKVTVRLGLGSQLQLQLQLQVPLQF